MKDPEEIAAQLYIASNFMDDERNNNKETCRDGAEVIRQLQAEIVRKDLIIEANASTLFHYTERLAAKAKRIEEWHQWYMKGQYYDPSVDFPYPPPLENKE